MKFQVTVIPFYESIVIISNKIKLNSVCLDFNIARMGLEDCEEVDDDIEARVQLDPSVWHPIKSGHGGTLNIPNEMLTNPMNVSHPFQQIGNQQIHPDQLHAQIQQHMVR